MLEKWLVRKEREIKARVNVPTPDLEKADAEIQKLIEKKFKPAREKLVAQMLANDSHGNKNKTEWTKDYNDLTADELHSMAEGLAVRLNLFDGNYPAFLPQVVRGIMEHKNLRNSDRSVLETYCTLFKLDWQGDNSLENKEQFLATHPVYVSQRSSYDELITADKVKSMLERACTPFLPELTQKFLAASETEKKSS